MKSKLVIAIFVLCVCSCNFQRPHEKVVQSQAVQAGLGSVSKSQLDAVFLAPDTDMRKFKKIILKDIDYSDVKIIEPSSSFNFQESWVLTDEDKSFYQKKFTESATNFLFEKESFILAQMPANDTLLLKTKITEIAPLASKDDFKSRPALIDVYSEGFGRMTIVFELYDSVSNKLLVVASDEHDLGRIWEKNNRVQNNVQIKLAFDYWLKKLKEDLNSIAKP